MDYNTFAGKVKSSDCSVTKLDLVYNQADCRCWSALINQGKDNIVVTHVINRFDYGSQLFDIFTPNKVLTDVETEDVFDTIELLVNKLVISEEISTEEA